MQQVLQICPCPSSLALEGEKRGERTAWRREHPEVDSVFALPGLFSSRARADEEMRDVEIGNFIIEHSFDSTQETK